MDLMDDETDHFAYLWMFSMYNKFPMPFWSRVRNAWHVMKYGSPYEDQMMVDLDELVKMREATDELIKTIGERERKAREKRDGNANDTKPAK